MRVSKAFPRASDPALQWVAKLVQFRPSAGWRRLQGGIMPLHYTKVFAFIALLTVAAFMLWLVWGAFFEGEEAEQPAALPNSAPATIQLALAS